MNIYKLLQQKAGHHGAKPFAFFSSEETGISYQGLLEGADAYAAWLESIGVRKSSRISLFIPKSKTYLCLYFALYKLGAINHTIAPNSNLQEADRIVKLFDPAFVLANESEVKKIKSNRHEQTSRLIALPKLDLLLQEKTDCSAFVETDLSDPAICIYTSGTTGVPKGILCSQKNLVLGAKAVVQAHKIREHDIALNTIPLSTINGQVTTILAPLISGGQVVYFQDMITTYGIFSCMEKFNVTWFSGIPTHFSIFVNTPISPNEFDLTHLQFMRSASAPLPIGIQEAFEKFYRKPIINTMGLTEMSGQVFANPRAIKKRKKGSVGQPILNQAKIVDSDGNELGPNKDGEIMTTGDNLMLGYFRDKNTTDQSIHNGWLSTGDLGYRDEDDFYFITGRKKDIVIIGGHNVSLKEVDEVLYGYRGVLKAATIGVSDEESGGGERLIAFVVAGETQQITESDLQKYCMETLTPYKVPQRFFFLDNLPEGGTGKILRTKVKQLYLEKYR